MIEALRGANAAKPSEFVGFGETPPVHDRNLIWCECSQTIRIPRIWLAAALFRIEALFGVSSAKPSEFLGFGEMHPVHD